MKLKFILAALLAVTALSACSAQADTKKNYGVAGPKLTYQGKVTTSNTYVVNGKSYTTSTHGNAKNYVKEGMASYYHSKFHGRRTASGEAYNASGYTAAHKTLPLGSYALVTNMRNNKKVIVRINDRGPFSNTRIMDLSKAAARELRMISSGVAKVRVEALHVERNGQISGSGASTLAKLAKTDNGRQRIQTNSQGSKITTAAIAKNSARSTTKPYNVRITNISSHQQAKELTKQLAQKNMTGQIKQKGDRYELHLQDLAGLDAVNQLKTTVNKLDKSQQLIVYTYN
ncbi:septal ring lytic transglycosylase RlpA family protein [Pasteurellaceae bacterium LIM206]|nr:septal ring lytic transglycosylase RlpA family protein [Pasteurellaceae bacterium LIM206]